MGKDNRTIEQNHACLKTLLRLKFRTLGLFNKLFGKNKTNSNDSEQAVTVRFIYGIDRLEPLHRLEKELEESINQEGVGEYDGHEIAIDYSDGYLFMYGPNAELLFKTIEPILERTEFMKGAVATLRFGPPEDGVSETEVTIKE